MLEIVSTAKRVLGMIKRSFCSSSKAVIVKLYQSLVRPLFKFHVQAWRPHMNNDIELIEGFNEGQRN
jgi:hypothetical protein